MRFRHTVLAGALVLGQPYRAALELLRRPRPGSGGAVCSGRTGLITAIALLELGASYEQVMADVRRPRPGALKLDVHLGYLEERKR